MKKIKTITCHRVYNHGASLQEFALLHYLNCNGFIAETINYQPKYLAENYSYLGVANPKFKKNIYLKVLYIFTKFPSKFYDRKRKRRFDKFEQEHIPVTKRVYRNNDQLKKNLPEADAYICGSDQIWNSFFQNGKDSAFYLDFVINNKKKISYAPSFAIDKIPEGWKEFIKQNVEKLDHISVREQSGLTILEGLGIKNAVQVLDPVFLLSKEEWESLFITSGFDKPYVLIYDFENDEAIKQYALMLKERFGFKIFSLNKNTRYADEIFWSYGPEKFLNLIYHSEFVLANSFHAMAFSVIFEKQFLIFNRKSKINTRMRDFLQSFGLSERLVFSLNEEQLSKSIDFSSIQVKKREMIEFSKNFIKHSLED